MRFEDKVALVTGAGSGIGKEAALLLAREGARVAALSRTSGEIEQTAREIEQGGGEALALTADVAQPEAMEQACARVEERWGRLDIVFANAGINGVWTPLEELAPEEWNATIATNLTGTFLTVKYALPLLKRQGGAIIITASINGTRVFSNTGATAYACSKAGQVAFTKMTALELARWHIRVNVVCPGAIATKIGDNTQQRNRDAVRQPVDYPEGEIPLTHGQPGTAEDVARLVAFLASDDARHITGTEVWVDGAESLLIG